MLAVAGQPARFKQAAAEHGCSLEVLAVRMGPIYPVDQPERAPRIEPAAVKFTNDIEALSGECGFQRGMPERGQE